MAPKPKPNAWQRFNTALQRDRDKRGACALPGSAFAGADSNARLQVELLVREVKVKTFGRSIFSTLALGLKVDERDEEPGMKLEVVEECVDESAMRAVERQEREREDEEAQGEREVVLGGWNEGDEVAKGRKDGGKGKKGKKKGKKQVMDLDGDEEMVDGEGEEQDDDVDRITVPDRKSARIAAKSSA